MHSCMFRQKFDSFKVDLFITDAFYFYFSQIKEFALPGSFEETRSEESDNESTDETTE